jgi:hypothetical protein
MEYDYTDLLETYLDEALHRIGNKLKSDIKKRLRDYDKIASRELINSIAYNVIPGQKLDMELEVGTNKEYLRYIEAGRLPGSMPPVSAIEKWLYQKNYRHRTFTPVNPAISREKQIKQQAWAIAVSMKNKGVPGFSVLRFALDQNEKFIEKEISNAIGRLNGR